MRTGNIVSGSGYGSATTTYNGSSFSSATYRPTSNVGVTVIMFHADEAGAKDAFEAEQVLKQYSQ
jgi:hypothetical protein